MAGYQLAPDRDMWEKCKRNECKQNFIPFNFGHFFLLQVANNERPTYDAFKKDIAIVNFYFDKGTALQYKRKVRITMEDLISQFGGTLGGFLGVSLLGVAEIIYWFTVRLCLNLRKSRKLKQAEKAAGTASLTPATNGKSEPGML